MSPYRESARVPQKPWSPAAWRLILLRILYALRTFQFARAWIGGHWERKWYAETERAMGLPVRVWAPQKWTQLEKCSEPEVPDTAGMPMDTECEDWE